MADTLAFFLPVEARESRPSIYTRFAIVRDRIPFSVLSCPFGAMDLGGALLARAARRICAAVLCPLLFAKAIDAFAAAEYQ